MEVAAGQLKKITLCGTSMFLIALSATIIFFPTRQALIGLSGSFVVSQINFLILAKVVRRLVQPNGHFLFSFFLILLKFLLIILAIAGLIHFGGANPVAMAVGFSIPVAAILVVSRSQ